MMVYNKEVNGHLMEIQIWWNDELTVSEVPVVFFCHSCEDDMTMYNFNLDVSNDDARNFAKRLDDNAMAHAGAE